MDGCVGLKTRYMMTDDALMKIYVCALCCWAQQERAMLVDIRPRSMQREEGVIDTRDTGAKSPISVPYVRVRALTQASLSPYSDSKHRRLS